jgi:hypothetical protein
MDLFPELGDSNQVAEFYLCIIFCWNLIVFLVCYFIIRFKSATQSYPVVFQKSIWIFIFSNLILLILLIIVFRVTNPSLI